MPKQVMISKKPENTFATPTSIGEAIRYKRTCNGLTLQDAASLCGLSKQAYQNAEKGTGNVRLGTLFKAMDAFGLSLTIENIESVSDEW